MIVQLKRETGNRGRERGSDMQQMVLRPGVKPRSAAVDQMFKNNFWGVFLLLRLPKISVDIRKT